VDVLTGIIWNFGPAGLVVFLVFVCLKKAASAREGAYKSRNQHRIVVDTCVYCANWLAIFVMMGFATVVFFSLNVRPKYIVQGEMTGARAFEVAFLEKQAIMQRSSADDDKMEWVIADTATLKGRHFLLRTKPRGSDGAGQKVWVLSIKEEHYNEIIQIVLEGDVFVPDSMVPVVHVSRMSPERLKPFLQGAAR
jgi:hypothetical protein